MIPFKIAVVDLQSALSININSAGPFVSSVALDNGVVDLACPFGINSSASFGGCVALERAVIDLHSALVNSNSSTLEVVCPPPGHREKFRKFLQTITHPLTYEALLLSKVESWITRVPSLM